MKFIKYEKIEDFVDENMELLLEKEWLNSLMVGNCLEGVTSGANEWILAKVTNNSNTELIMLYRKPWKLLMYSPTNNTSDELYEFAAKSIYEIDKELLGVNAETEIANKFTKYYCNIANKIAELEMPMRILVLEKLEEGKLVENAKLRIAKWEEKEILKQYIKDFYREALRENVSEEYVEEKLEKYFEMGYFVLEVDDRIVSQAVLSRKLIKGKSVSGVYTPKELRGKGYAYTLVYLLSKKYLDEGAKYCVLYTDDTNPISNHVYEKIGYKRMEDCGSIKFI